VSGPDGLAAQISEIGERARSVLDEKHAAREVALRVSRKTIQACAASIRAVHREEWDDAVRLADEAKAHLDEGEEAIAGHPDLRFAGYFTDAAKEFAEARVTMALVHGDPVPTPEEVGVESPLQEEAGATYAVDVDGTGIVKYACTPHEAAGMKGAVVVGEPTQAAGIDWFKTGLVGLGGAIVAAPFVASEVLGRRGGDDPPESTGAGDRPH
jgi:hypothetical protein